MTFKVNNYYISDNKAKYKCIRLTTQYAFMQDVHGRVEQRKILKDGKDEELKLYEDDFISAATETTNKVKKDEKARIKTVKKGIKNYRAPGDQVYRSIYNCSVLTEIDEAGNEICIKYFKGDKIGSRTPADLYRYNAKEKCWDRMNGKYKFNYVKGGIYESRYKIE